MVRRNAPTRSRAALPTASPRTLRILAALGVAALTAPAAATAQEGQHSAPALPDTAAITPATIDAGRAAFHGAGQCAACHGAHLEGGVGPTLKAHEWKDAKNGDLSAIYRVVTQGVPGTPMVAHPGGISDSVAVEVAAYIWAVNHRNAKP